MKQIVFACLHNAGRSQMAAAFFNALSDPGKARALSAGTRPAERIHPEVLEVMREAGHELSAARPRLLTPELLAKATLLVTLGCGEECPYVAGLRTQDWPIDDPKGLPPEEVREIRDQVRARVEALIDSEDCRGARART
jgi:arsenate reductase